MALYSGSPYADANVSIRAPDADDIFKLVPAADIAEEVKSLAWAERTAHVHFFSIYEDRTLVGQIYLHDIDMQSGDALIGYHLFQPDYRGRGIGARALGLLQTYVLKETAIKRLIIITGRDNGASRGIAAKRGFEYIGGAREDPENLVVYAWSTIVNRETGRQVHRETGSL